MSDLLVVDDPTLPDALHTPNGVVDLRSGEWLPFGDPPRTLATFVDPAEDSHGCDHWLSVLDEVTGGDEQSSQILGRFMGYSLGGHTIEQSILLFLGSGERKNNLIGAWAYAMGAYAETLLTTLHIMRYPSAFGSSARANKRMLTSAGDMPIMLGNMSSDFVRCATTYEPLEVEHEPQFKLVLTTDAFSPLDIFPEIDNELVPCVHMIHTQDSAPSVDLDLARDLMAEAPSILRWLIDRHLEWRRDGLPGSEAA